MEIFSLLSLEKCNLDWVKPDQGKKDECRWYRPCTFFNWLKTFLILAGGIEEKAPDNCSSLFCYLDSIGGGGYSVYVGNTWLCYDKQF